MHIQILGVLAGIMQALGYGLYLRSVLEGRTIPNPTSWLMFGYSTVLVLVLEWDRGGAWAILVLPATCAACSLAVVFVCWRRSTIGWPDNLVDQWALGSDLTLTTLYVSGWILLALGFIREEFRSMTVLVILMCENASTFSGFVPLVRGVYLDARVEELPAWAAWTVAYTLLCAATYLEHGLWTELMLYPGINVGIHATVAFLARGTRRRSCSRVLPTE